MTGQDPAPGEEVEEGTAVRINVSKGPRPIEVPNVVGQSFESAQAALQGAGLAVGERRDVESDEPEGTVVSQDPEPGDEVARGTPVTLEVSQGPATTTVPPVTGLDEEQARAALEDAGFRVRVEQLDTGDPNFDGIVIEQDPPEGSEAEPGSRVTIRVGRFREGE